jgi:hypothetical protein
MPALSRIWRNDAPRAYAESRAGSGWRGIAHPFRLLFMAVTSAVVGSANGLLRQAGVL